MSATRYQLEVTEAETGQRLDRALTALVQAYAPLSRARVQALLKEKAVTLKGKVISDVSRQVHAGEVYELTVPEAVDEAVIEARELPLEIIYEDDDLLVINKPAGLVVHPAAGHHDDTLVNALLWHKREALSGIGGVKRPGIVHRLDKDTSGLMVVAKHDEAHHKLSAQFADRSLSRTYLALVWGVPKPAKGRIEGAIGRSPTNRQKMAVTKNGKPAATRYVVEKAVGKQMALVRCELETGRTHQIRVHLTHIGHPLVGDPIYGTRRKTDFKRQALHAAELKLIHPRTGKPMQFSCELPLDMADFLA
jgi:23S rRNA pseudouridine1911/1915/1917 synthase